MLLALKQAVAMLQMQSTCSSNLDHHLRSLLVSPLRLRSGSEAVLCCKPQQQCTWTYACQCFASSGVACLNLETLVAWVLRIYRVNTNQRSCFDKRNAHALCCYPLILQSFNISKSKPRSFLRWGAGRHRHWASHVPKQPFVHPQSSSHEPRSPLLCQHALQSSQAFSLPQHVRYQSQKV